MQQILVKAKKPTDRGRLHPRYDAEAGALEVGSHIARDWPFGVDIDGRLIFDLDADRVLANFDLLIPRERWPVARRLEGPGPARAADLQFDAQTIAHKSFSLDLAIRCDQRRTLIQITFDHVARRPMWVGLSERCWAGLDADRLVGLFVSLAP